MKIILRPVGNIDNHLLEELQAKLSQNSSFQISIARAGVTNLERAYDPRRKQYHSTELLDCLKTPEIKQEERVLGIADVDLYVPGLNFVFGEADIESRVAIISLTRLRQEYYGLPPDKALFLERALKEMVHELGHTFNLQHCPDAKCVMHFSNSLTDTDLKGTTFCSRCGLKFRRWSQSKNK